MSTGIANLDYLCSIPDCSTALHFKESKEESPGKTEHRAAERAVGREI